MISLTSITSTGKPCLIDKVMSNEEYHSYIDFWGSSRLRDVILNSDNLKQKLIPTKPMIFGTNFHCFLLEYKRFMAEYVIFDEANRKDKTKTMAAKENKEWEAEFYETNSDKKIVSKKDFDAFVGMRKRLYEYKHDGEYPIRKLIENNTAETSIFVDGFENMKVKIRPDIFIQKKFWLGDLKVTANASDKAFKSKAIEMRYNMQAALYQDVLEDVYGIKIQRNFWLAIEPEAPYSFNLITIPDEAIECGRELYRYAFEKARTTLEYNGYMDSVPSGKIFKTMEWTKYDTERCFKF